MILDCSVPPHLRDPCGHPCRERYHPAEEAGWLEAQPIQMGLLGTYQENSRIRGRANTARQLVLVWCTVPPHGDGHPLPPTSALWGKAAVSGPGLLHRGCVPTVVTRGARPANVGGPVVVGMAVLAVKAAGPVPPLVAGTQMSSGDGLVPRVVDWRSAPCPHPGPVVALVVGVGQTVPDI